MAQEALVLVISRLVPDPRVEDHRTVAFLRREFRARHS